MTAALHHVAVGLRRRKVVSPSFPPALAIPPYLNERRPSPKKPENVSSKLAISKFQHCQTCMCRSSSCERSWRSLFRCFSNRHPALNYPPSATVAAHQLSICDMRKQHCSHLQKLRNTRTFCSDADSNTPDRYVQLNLGATEGSPSTPILRIWMDEVDEMLFRVNSVGLLAVGHVQSTKSNTAIAAIRKQLAS